MNNPQQATFWTAKLDVKALRKKCPWVRILNLILLALLITTLGFLIAACSLQTGFSIVVIPFFLSTTLAIFLLVFIVAKAPRIEP